jgi:hypothetical protein
MLGGLTGLKEESIFISTETEWINELGFILCAPFLFGQLTEYCRQFPLYLWNGQF